MRCGSIGWEVSGEGFRRHELRAKVVSRQAKSRWESEGKRESEREREGQGLGVRGRVRVNERAGEWGVRELGKEGAEVRG